MSKQTIEDLEKELEEVEMGLETPRLAMPLWSPLVSRWHALHIKLCQMRGEQPIVSHVKADYII